MADAQARGPEDQHGSAALFARWVHHVRRGDLEAAWRISDEVVRRRRGVPCSHLPRHQQYFWDGCSLAGRRILVRCQHGLGDTILFARFLPALRAIAARVAVVAPAALLPLLEAVPGIDALLPLTDDEPDADRDVDVEIMELAHAFRVTLSTLPARVPYLHAPKIELGRRSGLRVGIVWRAGDLEGSRSMPAEHLAPLAALAGIEWHVLQRGPALAERPDWLTNLTGSDDLLHAAGVIRSLDLVITVDSMPAHLAGSLGVPVWTLLPADCDWRWLADRDDTPWYPTMRLIRQPTAGDWPAVVRRVAALLHARSLPDARVRPSALRRAE